MLFVTAGITKENGAQSIGGVSTDDFVRVMVTNALSPLRVIERLDSLVSPTGLIGVMSSRRGSIANNETGQPALYRGSKSALNQFMRSYAARQAGAERPMVLMAPRWGRAALGGPGARLTIAESIPHRVTMLLAKRARPAWNISIKGSCGRRVSLARKRAAGRQAVAARRARLDPEAACSA